MATIQRRLIFFTKVAITWHNKMIAGIRNNQMVYRNQQNYINSSRSQNNVIIFWKFMNVIFCRIEGRQAYSFQAKHIKVNLGEPRNATVGINNRYFGSYKIKNILYNSKVTVQSVNELCRKEAIKTNKIVQYTNLAQFQHTLYR